MTPRESSGLPLADVLRTEVLERAIRLLFLVKRSTRHLSVTFRTDTAQNASANQIQELLEHLVIRPLLEDTNDNSALQLDRVRALLQTVAIIHEGALPTVPRTVEPIELRSYLRQSGDEKNRGKQFPLVFASERLGMQVYPNSLAGLLNRIARRQLLIARAKHEVSGIKDLASALLADKLEAPPPSFLKREHAYVAIPAIDIHNPNRWPSLWHELAHHRLLEQSKSLIDEFEEQITGGIQGSNAFSRLCIAISPLAVEELENVGEHQLDDQTRSELGKRLIENWLRECWCDAFGVGQAGVAFLYSQLHDFMFCFEGYLDRSIDPGQAYPPADFRLKLASNLALERLRHRANDEDSSIFRSLVDDYEKEESLFFEMAGASPTTEKFAAHLSLLFTQFLAFLKASTSLKDDASFGGDVSKEVFDELEADLKEGLPIPSILSKLGGSSRAAKVSEIVLAGWRHRNSKMRGDLHEVLRSCSQAVAADGEEKDKAIHTLIATVGELIDRTDESIKRSIQVAEWFSILHDSPAGRENNASLLTDIHQENPYLAAPGLLSDFDINLLLDGDTHSRPELRIVPLINRAEQVKGSVIDLRLGHNFEVFQSLVVKAIDACDESVDGRVDSLEVEIDFLEGLPVLPGQFVLGHTLEYIKLPTNIAAQIEGRSSFARLGIQVHMTANLVEAGFDGCLTLEIHNNGPSTVVLYPGMRIAQLRFFRMASNASKPYGRASNKYRGQLSHNKTKQFTDPEVEVFRRKRKERNAD